MDICSHGHAEIVFDGRTCPLCESFKEHEDEVSSLKDDISDMKKTISRLEAEIEEPLIPAIERARNSQQ